MDRLTLEQVEAIRDLPWSGENTGFVVKNIARQLAETIRENEQLQEALIMKISSDLQSNNFLDKHPDDHRAVALKLDENGNAVQELVCIYKDCPEHQHKHPSYCKCPVEYASVNVPHGYCGQCGNIKSIKQAEGIDYQATILGTGEKFTLHYPPETPDVKRPAAECYGFDGGVTICRTVDEINVWQTKQRVIQTKTSE